MRFRLVPKSMTLDDLERPKGRSCRNKQNLRSAPKNLKEDRSILLAAECRPMIPVSRNVKYTYMRIFAGVPSGRGCQVQ